jgi:hypothetical protein
MYANGQGVPQDLILAHMMWFNLSAAGSYYRRKTSLIPLDPFAACSGALLHRVPRRLRGLVVGRRLTPEVAYYKSSSNAFVPSIRARQAIAASSHYRRQYQ